MSSTNQLENYNNRHFLRAAPGGPGGAAGGGTTAIGGGGATGYGTYIGFSEPWFTVTVVPVEL